MSRQLALLDSPDALLVQVERWQKGKSFGPLPSLEALVFPSQMFRLMVWGTFRRDTEHGTDHQHAPVCSTRAHGTARAQPHRHGCSKAPVIHIFKSGLILRYYSLLSEKRKVKACFLDFAAGRIFSIIILEYILPVMTVVIFTGRQYLIPFNTSLYIQSNPLLLHQWGP